MLSERTLEQISIFKEGFEAEYFSSKNELLNKIKFYLNNEKKRIKICKSGYKKCIQSNYTMKNQIKNVLRLIS